jgi:hypothetical protein
VSVIQGTVALGVSGTSFPIVSGISRKWRNLLW